MSRTLGRRMVLRAVALVAATLALFTMPVATWAETHTGEIVVAHTNDIHGYYTYDSRNGAIGFPIAQTLLDEIDPDLVLDAGDTFHGQSFATVTEGESIAQLMDALGFDATTPGNHDWSYGAAQLEAIDAASDFSVLAANVVDSATGEPAFGTSITKDVEVTLDDGTTEVVRMGVLGVIDEDFYTSTPVANVAGLTFTDPVAAANQAAAELRAAGCDVVIALTHNEDPEGFAQATAGIDAVIAGHEHLVIDTTVANSAGDEVAVVEAGHYFQYLGVLNLAVALDDDGTWDVTGHTESPIPFTDVTEDMADADVAAMVAEIEADNDQILAEVIGSSTGSYPYSSTELPGGWERVRTEDTPIGHLVTASYLDATGADLAIENAGGIRGGVEPGDVTAGDLVSFSPYGNTLATYTMTGAQVLDTFQRSYDLMWACRDVLQKQTEALEAGEDPYAYTWPDSSGSVLVIGGATVEADWSRPEGERVVSLTIDGEPIDPARTYTVAMNSYVPQLTDLYPAFANMQLAQEWGSCEQALRSFVGSDGWEDVVYPLSGTVFYVEAADPDEPTTPDEPVQPDEPAVPGEGDGAGDSATDVAGTPQDLAGATTVAGKLPQTGDFAGLAGAVAAAGVGLVGIGGAASRRRSADDHRRANRGVRR